VLDGRWRREEDDNMNYVTNGQIYIGIVILLISAILSFSSKKIGIISNITICAITIFFGIGGVYVGASIESLYFGCIACPVIAWFGFWIGRIFGKKRSK
jgi:hypothetical protein